MPEPIEQRLDEMLAAPAAGFEGGLFHQGVRRRRRVRRQRAVGGVVAVLAIGACVVFLRQPEPAPEPVPKLVGVAPTVEPASFGALRSTWSAWADGEVDLPAPSQASPPVRAVRVGTRVPPDGLDELLDVL